MKRLACVLLLAVSARAGAGEFELRSRRWDGLSTLADEAAALGCRIETPARLDVSALRPEDAVWILHPTRALPAADLIAFVEAGGSLMVADDFGEAGSVFARFGLERVPVTGGARFDQNPNLPIATQTGIGRLGIGQSLVADHASALRGSLPASFEFKHGEGLVHEALVGEGSAILISDSSIFINNLLEIEGNLEFTRALLRVSCVEHGRGQRMLLIAEDTPLAGHYAGTPPPNTPSLPMAARVRAVATQLNERAAAVANALPLLAPPLLALLSLSVLLFGAAGLAQLSSRRARFDRQFFRSAASVAMSNDAEAPVALLARRLEEWWNDRRGRLRPAAERRAAALLDQLEQAQARAAFSDEELTQLYRNFTQLVREDASQGNVP